MSYNWTSASSPQGRERLKELADNGVIVFARCKGREGMFYNVWATMSNPFRRAERYSLLMRLDNVSKPFDWYIENDIEFLDPEPSPKADKTHEQLAFGDYVCIEQFRYGVPHEFFQYKVIGRHRSNCWVDTPVKHTPTKVLHDSMDDVILCICCGIDETEVLPYRLSDVVPHGRYWELNRRAGKEANP